MGISSKTAQIVRVVFQEYMPRILIVTTFEVCSKSTPLATRGPVTGFAA